MAYGDGAHSQTAYSATASVLSIIIGSSTIEVDTVPSINASRRRDGKGTIEVSASLDSLSQVLSPSSLGLAYGSTGYGASISQLFGFAKATISIDASFDSLARRLRGGKSVIDSSIDVEALTTRIKQTASIISSAANVFGKISRLKLGASSIEISSDMSALPERIRGGDTTISLDVGFDAKPRRIRRAISVIQIASSLMVKPTLKIAVGGTINISSNLSGTLTRQKPASSAVTIEVPIAAEGGVPSVLMSFSGSLASGGSIEIDGEDLLITDPDTGENLRPQFDVSNWPEIPPQGATLIWEDQETGRTIKLEIDKQDRSV